MKKFRTLLENWECKLLALAFFAIIFFYGWQERQVLADFLRTLSSRDPAAITEALDGLETAYQQNTYDKNQLVNLDGALYNLAGRTRMNDVIKLNNGHLTSVREQSLAAPQNGDTIVFTHQWLGIREIPFLFVLAPYNICALDKQLPLGVSDYTNEDADEFLVVLYENQVPVLDLRSYLHQEGKDHYEMFFATDHHWTIESSFWAFQKLTEYMEINWDFSVDPVCTDLNNYEIRIYEDWSLGSKGKRTGRYFAGMDDFSLIYPKFDTQMSLSIPSEGIQRSGSFYDTIFAMDRIENTDYFSMIPYDGYIGGVYPLVIHENPQAKVDKKILMIKDSYASPVEAFLSTCFTQVHCLDMRQYQGKVGDYIEEFQPDAVICFYNTQIVTNAEMFWFGF
ncbi:MAG: hypothetical protein HFI31_03200 [Lachnospiraceae bacterium]|jgi:hypothetical protein|nr:hypothetical protein [Lachnospiraceae bacterium]MCI8994444.1 hypothetical protein [Lachnospiraceae bacterium]MCI9133186.1 hypothetical protein [Lachnospiraceae bacterium]